jgi:hypothetical protein
MNGEHKYRLPKLAATWPTKKIIHNLEDVPCYKSFCCRTISFGTERGRGLNFAMIIDLAPHFFLFCSNLYNHRIFAKTKCISLSYSMIMYVFAKSLDWLIIWGFTSCSRIFHFHRMAAKFRPMLGAQGLWAGRDLYRATDTVTQGLDFSDLIQRNAPFSRLLQHTRGVEDLF